jgi:hypothetical protein
MAGRASVPARMPIRRRVAAQGGPATLTRSEMHPSGIDLDAFLTHSRFCEFHLVERVNVSAGVWHSSSVSWRR